MRLIFTLTVLLMLILPKLGLAQEEFPLVARIQELPELRKQDLEIEAARERYLQEKKGWLSSFKLGVQFLSISQDFDAGVTQVGILPTIGLNLQLDLERFSTTRSRVRAALIEREIAQYEYERIHIEKIAEFNALYLEWAYAKEQVDIRFQSLNTMKEQALLQEERFRDGEIDLNDYLNSVNALDNAREAYAQANSAEQKLRTQIQTLEKYLAELANG